MSLDRILERFSDDIIVESLILLITVTIMYFQTREAKRATYVGSFKSAFDILQVDSIREARRIVLQDLVAKEYDQWTDAEKATAEKVIHTYDAVGVMVRSRLIPVHMIANHWGDSLRKSWPILKPMVLDTRKKRIAEELFDDFAWLAEKAKEYPQRRIRGYLN